MTNGKLNNVLSFKDHTSLCKLENKPGKVLERFETINEEIIGQKFFTGHDSKNEKEKAKEQILSDLDETIEIMKESPEKFAQTPESVIEHIERESKRNNWRGFIDFVTSKRDELIYITYVPKKTDLQNIGSISTRLGGSY